MQIRYNVYYSSGNPTALVKGIPTSEEERKQINDLILAENEKIEQVGFINLDKANPELKMAGGEFCGNASRSAIYYYLEGKDGELELTVSGVEHKLRGGIKKGITWLEMPIKQNEKEAIQKRQDGYLINLDGISHLIIEEIPEDNDLKKLAFQLIQSNHLDKLEACGVLFLKETQDYIQMEPIVYVSQIETLFYETACGSGTTAVGIYKSYIERKNVSLRIKQPTGEFIDVMVERSNNGFEKAIISGKIVQLT